MCPGDELSFGSKDAEDSLRYRVKMVHESVWDTLGNGKLAAGNGKLAPEEDREPEMATV